MSFQPEYVICRAFVMVKQLLPCTINLPTQVYNYASSSLAYAGTVKRYIICKRHVAIDNGVNQTECTAFLHIISTGLKL